jgi:hypothetical protein
MRSLYNMHEINTYGSGSVCLSSRFNSRTFGRIFMKSGTSIMPLSTLYLDAGFEALKTVVKNIKLSL